MTAPPNPARLIALAVLVLWGGGAPARAGDTAPRPRGWAVSGEATGTLAPEDQGFFNDTSYDRNALRLFRLSLTAALRPQGPVSLLAEVRSENADAPRAYALFLRARPVARWPVDLQAGLVPPVFGAYPRERYARESPFLATPIAYQYLTTLRPDAVPGSASDLLRVRGEGWRLRFPLGERAADAGLPLADGLRYDTGVSIRYGGPSLEAAAALTRGSLSRPVTRDDNDGRAISSRVVWRPRAGLVLGGSQSRGEWLGRDAQDALAQLGRAPARQSAWGADVEASAGYWLVRGEAVWSAWSGLPVGPSSTFATVRARGVTVEGRFRPAPGANVGLRAEHLGFSTLAGAGPLPWEAPVTRLEAGCSYVPVRHLVLKAGYQRNWRDGGRVRRSGLFAAQATAWF